MNYLGIDYGEKRIGLSYGDALGVAVPLPAAVGKTEIERLEAIDTVIHEREIEALVVGYPYNMDGSVGFKAKEVDAFIAKLEERFGLPVHRVDERLSSEQAMTDMDAFKMKKEKTPKGHQKARKTGELDSRAAALILQDFLDTQIA